MNMFDFIFAEPLGYLGKSLNNVGLDINDPTDHEGKFVQLNNGNIIYQKKGENEHELENCV